jgi:hypothetical protein
LLLVSSIISVSENDIIDVPYSGSFKAALFSCKSQLPNATVALEQALSGLLDSI